MSKETTKKRSQTTKPRTKSKTKVRQRQKQKLMILIGLVAVLIILIVVSLFLSGAVGSKTADGNSVYILENGKRSLPSYLCCHEITKEYSPLKFGRTGELF